MIWEGSLLALVAIVTSLLIIGLNALWMVKMRNNAIKMARNDAAEERFRFLRRLDHELKNPLTAMQIGLANLARVERNPTPEHVQIQESIRGQITRLNRLVSSLRKLADLEFSSIERIALKPGDLLQETFDALVDYPESEHRKLKLSLANADLPKIEGDPDLLQLAVHNLLDNAIKFTEAGDEIELAVAEQYTKLFITVRDTGRGIPEDDLPHVWEDLYRSQSVHGIPGNGIGLPLVKAIIEKHEGTAEIESTPGEGTIVRLSLPTLLE